MTLMIRESMKQTKERQLMRLILKTIKYARVQDNGLDKKHMGLNRIHLLCSWTFI